MSSPHPELRGEERLHIGDVDQCPIVRAASTDQEDREIAHGSQCGLDGPVCSGQSAGSASAVPRAQQ
jgi:hypothetical protein